MAAAPAFDLQAHSTHSDGELPPAEVVRTAATAGIELLAHTDHDTVSGVDEALRAGAGEGVRMISAIELSATDDLHEELHVLGYAIDHHDEAFNAPLADLRADCERRVMAMADRLRAAGFAVDDRELNKRRSAGEPLGRPQLAHAVLSHSANVARLGDEGIVSVRELFPRYLVSGTSTYVPRSKPTVADAVALIHSVGGVAVWAHPFWDVEDADELTRTVRRFMHLGIDGVEAFYATHDRRQVELLCVLAQELDLLTTGSSDFHGPNHKIFAEFGNV